MSSYDTAILADNPAGYWPLGETSGTVAADLSVHAVAGAYIGSPSLGQPSIALVLNDSIQCPGSSNMTVPPNTFSDFNTGSFSVEAWIRPNALSGFQEFFSSGQDLRFFLTNANLWWFSDGGLILASAGSLTVGAPFHVVATTDNVTFITNIYINGVLDSTRNVGGTTHPTGVNRNLVIGSLDGAGTQQYTGHISNVATYAYALTAGQVAAHYTAGTVPAIVVPDVVGLMDSAARAAILAASLTVGTISTVSGGIPGQVTAQSPIAGAVVPGGTPVDLTEYLGVLVPNVVNTSATIVAPGIITGAGFTVGAITYAPDVLTIAGNVSIQNPSAGSFAAAGSAIRLVVSTGRAALLVPDIIGDILADATIAIVDAGFILSTVTYAPSLLFPAGEVIAQNPSGGTPVAYGSNLSVVISLGVPTVNTAFDFEATVISQYANSPTILQLVKSMNGYIDQTQNFANFYNFVWNVDTAEGFGLDVWGHIVNVSRLLQIPTGARYVGFQDGTGPGPSTDVEPFGPGGAGSWFTPVAASTGYLLEDGPYRQLILTKALANIVNTTVPAFNQLLQNLFPGRGNPYVTTSGVMAMTFTFDFDLTPIELAILEQSGAVPVPPGVSFTIVVP